MLERNKIQLPLKWFFSNKYQIYNFLDHYFALRKWLSRKCQKIHFWKRNEPSILSYNLRKTHWHVESTHWISETIWTSVETIFEKFQEDEWHFCWANSFQTGGMRDSHSLLKIAVQQIQGWYNNLNIFYIWYQFLIYHTTEKNCLQNLNRKGTLKNCSINYFQVDAYYL